MAQNIDKPILYSFRRCPYAMRARLALMISKQSCCLREIILRDKPVEMLKISPKGTVPVLLLKDGRILEESLDIMYWALERHDPQNWLRESVSDRKEIAGLIDQNDKVFKFHLDRYKYPNRYEGEIGLDHRGKAEVVLQSLEQRLALHRYLLSDVPSLADFALFPFVRQFAHVDKVWFDAAPLPHVQQWLADFLVSDLFVSIMKKFKPWNETGRISGVEILFPEIDKQSKIKALNI